MSIHKTVLLNAVVFLGLTALNPAQAMFGNLFDEDEVSSVRSVDSRPSSPQYSEELAALCVLDHDEMVEPADEDRPSSAVSMASRSSSSFSSRSPSPEPAALPDPDFFADLEARAFYERVTDPRFLWTLAKHRCQEFVAENDAPIRIEAVIATLEALTARYKASVREQEDYLSWSFMNSIYSQWEQPLKNFRRQLEEKQKFIASLVQELGYPVADVNILQPLFQQMVAAQGNDREHSATEALADALVNTLLAHSPKDAAPIALKILQNAWQPVPAVSSSAWCFHPSSCMARNSASETESSVAPHIKAATEELFSSAARQDWNALCTQAGKITDAKDPALQQAAIKALEDILPSAPGAPTLWRQTIRQTISNLQMMMKINRDRARKGW